MSRPTPTNWRAVNPSDLGSDRPIKASVETDLIENLHWLYLEDRPPVVKTVFSGGSVAGGGSAYAVGAGSMSINALWTREIIGEPFVEYDVQVAWANTDPVNSGTIRFDIESDPYSGTTGTGVDLTATANTAAWQVSTVTLPVDTSQGVDTIRMQLESPGGGEVRVHSVEIRPKAPSSIAAGQDAEGFVPLDTVLVDADSPLSSHLRQVEVDDLEVIRKGRTDTIVGWSEDFRVRTSGGAERFENPDDIWKTVLVIPFRSQPGQNELRWSLHGYYAAGTGGDVQMWCESDPNTVESVVLQSTWSSPYTAARHQWDDAGQSALTCRDNGWDRLHVQLKNGGTVFTGTILNSFSAWFGEAD